MSFDGYQYSRQRHHEPDSGRLRHDSFMMERKSSDMGMSIKLPSSPSIVPWDLETPSLPMPCKENDWLGFCSSAVRLQSGEKKAALKKRTDYSASFAAAGLTTYYCSARGCSFQGHISIDFAWKTVMKDDKLGLKCRWAFLAKSHVRQTNVSGRQYQYQCPICIFQQGHAEGRIWKGVEIFMDHVSTHRGKELYPEVIKRLNIINDHTADEKEDFDLNLIPPASRNRENTSLTSRSRDSVSTVTRGRDSVVTIKPAENQSPTPPLSRQSTRSSIAESVWSRKDSSILNLTSFGRSHTNRGERADSLLTGAVDERGEYEFESDIPWSAGLSNFKMDKEEDYFSPDF